MFALFTDFGLTGPYIGQMSAKLLSYAPDQTVVNLMSDVPAFNINAASILLDGLYDELPEDTIYLCIVDPGVGGERKPIFIKHVNRYFVGPDNGIFSELLKNNPDIEAYEINWIPEKLSNSFHGRDLFAPIAAKIHLSKPFEMQNIQQNDLSIVQNNSLKSIIYRDTYGNLWTGLKEKDLQKTSKIFLKDHELSYRPVFSDTEVGDLFWYYNSSGFVEIACNQGNASDQLSVDIDEVFEIIL